jgi:hypothetical protein
LEKRYGGRAIMRKYVQSFENQLKVEVHLREFKACVIDIEKLAKREPSE